MRSGRRWILHMFGRHHRHTTCGSSFEKAKGKSCPTSNSSHSHVDHLATHSLSTHARGITIFICYHLQIDLRYMLYKVFCALFSMWSSKTLLTRPNSTNAEPFFAGRFFFCHSIVSIWQSCGKPSTKFPHGGLVERILNSTHSFLIPSRICLETLKNSEKSEFVAHSWFSRNFQNGTS